MQPLIAELAHSLESEGTPYALIGAAAMLVHNAPRLSLDFDLLVVESDLLRADWKARLSRGVNVEVRRGDADDPLAGVISFSRPGETDVDLVIGRWKWQEQAIARARTASLHEVALPIISAADLVILKIDAGGYRDRTDADLLLERNGERLVHEVRELLPSLPEPLRTDCERFLAERS